MIQKHIIKKLKVKNTSPISNHRSSSSDPCQSLSLFSIDQQVRIWQSLAGRLRQYAELMSNQERDPDESPNTIAHLESEILGLMSRVSESTIAAVLDTPDFRGIRHFINEVSDPDR